MPITDDTHHKFRLRLKREGSGSRYSIFQDQLTAVSNELVGTIPIERGLKLNDAKDRIKELRESI